GRSEMGEREVLAPEQARPPLLQGVQRDLVRGGGLEALEMRVDPEVVARVEVWDRPDAQPERAAAEVAQAVLRTQPRPDEEVEHGAPEDPGPAVLVVVRLLEEALVEHPGAAVFRGLDA